MGWISCHWKPEEPWLIKDRSLPSRHTGPRPPAQPPACPMGTPTASPVVLLHWCHSNPGHAPAGSPEGSAVRCRSRPWTRRRRRAAGTQKAPLTLRSCRQATCQGTWDSTLGSLPRGLSCWLHGGAVLDTRSHDGPGSPARAGWKHGPSPSAPSLPSTPHPRDPHSDPWPSVTRSLHPGPGVPSGRRADPGPGVPWPMKEREAAEGGLSHGPHRLRRKPSPAAPLPSLHPPHRTPSQSGAPRRHRAPSTAPTRWRRASRRRRLQTGRLGEADLRAEWKRAGHGVPGLALAGLWAPPPRVHTPQAGRQPRPLQCPGDGPGTCAPASPPEAALTLAERPRLPWVRSRRCLRPPANPTPLPLPHTAAEAAGPAPPEPGGSPALACPWHGRGRPLRGTLRLLSSHSEAQLARPRPAQPLICTTARSPAAPRHPGPDAPQ